MFIKNKRLLALFEQFAINQNYRVLLPETWKKLNKQNFEYFITKFDPKGKGEIELWIVLEIASLTNYVMPSSKELEQYELLLCDHNPNFK